MSEPASEYVAIGAAAKSLNLTPSQLWERISQGQCVTHRHGTLGMCLAAGEVAKLRARIAEETKAAQTPEPGNAMEPAGT